MPQMPETQGFLEIFREMLGLDLISQEWGIGLSPWIIALIVIICCLIIMGAIAYAAWCKWTHEEEGITIGERMKKALSFKQD